MSVAPATLVDAHAHLYPGFPLAAFLDGAWENFRRGAAALGRPLAEGVLLLAQTAGDDGFERLAAAAGRAGAAPPASGAWTLEPTGEAVSLAARRADGARLIVACGRQVRTAEGLELLALATLWRGDDGAPLTAALDDAAAAGALTVLPWGVGKWLGRRGRIVRDLLDAAHPGLACGDSANRPRLWPTPGLLRRARSRGLRVLPGSDPLPLPGEEGRAGRLGFAVPGPLAPARPAAALLALLADPAVPAAPFGRLESPARFLRNQLLLRVGAGRPRAAAALALALLLSVAACSGGGPAGPEEIDIGDNHPRLGWAFGDSLTHGRDSLFSYQLDPLNDAGPDEPGYRVRLQQLLAADGRTVTLVEDGSPGTYSAAGVRRLWRALAAQPAFLVLLYGSNDAYAGLPVAELEANLRSIVEECRQRKIVVVLCTLPPICDLAGPIPRIDAYTAAIRSLAAGLDARWGGVLLADLDKAFRARGKAEVCRLLNPVGTHPTREGYELIADTVFDQLHEVTWRGRA